MWNFLLGQLLRQAPRRAGKTLARLAFNKELNAPEVYADRIKRDFRLHDYADAWNLYASDPAYWERYYNPPSYGPDPKDTFVRDSAAGAGVPSRRNVFEYDYPGSASGPPAAKDVPVDRASDHAALFSDRYGSWPAFPAGSGPAQSSGAPGGPGPNPPDVVRTDDVRRLTRESAPRSTDVLASGSPPVPYLASSELNDRFGNWRMPPDNGQGKPQASRPIGVLAGEPGYTIPPPIWGLEGQGGAPRNDAQEWFARWIKPLLQQ